MKLLLVALIVVGAAAMEFELVLPLPSPTISFIQSELEAPLEIMKLLFGEGLSHALQPFPEDQPTSAHEATGSPSHPTFLPQPQTDFQHLRTENLPQGYSLFEQHVVKRSDGFVPPQKTQSSPKLEGTNLRVM